VPIAAGASQVVADFGVAVDHQATCGLSSFSVERSSQRFEGAKPSNRGRDVPLITR
jgi:hypothetical protein